LKAKSNDGPITSNIAMAFRPTATVMILPCIWRLLLVFFRPNLVPTTSKIKINICSSRFKLEVIGAFVPNSPDMITDIKYIR
jgi:hypothetical protein